VPMIYDWWLMIDNKDKAYELYAGPTELQRDAVVQWLDREIVKYIRFKQVQKDC